MIDEVFGLTYRKLSKAEREMMFEARPFAQLINGLTQSREKKLVVARLEEALMWTSKHIALHGL